MSTRSDNPSVIVRRESADRQGSFSPTEVAARRDTARLAHELNNLLDGSLRHIGLAVRALRETSPGQTESAGGDEQALRRLDTASAALRQMAELIQGWTSGEDDQPNAPSQEGQSKPRATLIEAMQGVVTMLQPLAETSGVTIDLQLSHIDHRVICTSKSIVRAVDNLIRNSIEAIAERQSHQGDERRRVTLILERHSKTLEIRVVDTGPGFATTLFNVDGGFRFGQTTKSAGQGIGLSLCCDVVRKLGGTLQLTNRESGGASVAIRVPMSAVQNRRRKDDPRAITKQSA